MPPRFYCPDMSSPGPVTLTEAESHHLAHVLRLTVGEIVELFNGQGMVGQAVVEAVRKRDVVCTVSATHLEPVSRSELILATAIPKGERFDWLVEKAVELGVSRLIPLQTARSTVDPRGTKLDRLRQTIVSACKQCRRSRVMMLDPVTPWRDLLAQHPPGRLLIAHPGGEKLAGLASSAQRPAWVACVGPEGGFTEEEIAAGLQKGGLLVGLGEHPLRIETACIALATWGLFQRQAFGTVKTGP